MHLLKNVDALAYQALHEDLGTGDITAELLPTSCHAKTQLIAREPAILCGIPWFNSVFKQLDEQIDIHWLVKDGDAVMQDQTLCTLQGSGRSLLTGERSAINFVQTLSGTATMTRKYMEILQNTQTKLLDTRKTIPGMREAQKYAVRCGGGDNHRFGLFDGILLKENHITALGSISKAIELAKKLYPETSIEVEVENLSELQQALDARTDAILLDNFSLTELHEAILINNKQVKLEASGNINLENLSAIAKTGVDYVSIGALTKNITALDLSMRFF